MLQLVAEGNIQEETMRIFRCNLTGTMISVSLSMVLVTGYAAALEPPAPAQVRSELPFPPPPSPPAPPPPPPMPIKETPVIERVSPGVFRIGDVLINKKELSVSFPAEVNMDRGLLEYLLVRVGGKTHESLLRTKVEPYQLQVAFLLLGYEGTNNPLAGQGDPRTPTGDAVDITVTRADSAGKPAPADYTGWMCKIIDKKQVDIPKLEWVYTGSVVFDGRFRAQMEGSIIALYHDPAALVDNASEGGESDKVWFVREGAPPPVGTPVTVTIKRKK